MKVPLGDACALYSPLQPELPSPPGSVGRWERAMASTMLCDAMLHGGMGKPGHMMAT